MLSSERVVKIPIRGQNDRRLCLSELEDLGVSRPLLSDLPEVQNHVGSPFEKSPGGFREILVQQERHATLSYGAVWKSEMPAANSSAAEIWEFESP